MESCTFSDASTQTDVVTLSSDSGVNVLFSSLRNNCEAEVQTNLSVPRVNKQTMTDTGFKRDCGVNVGSVDVKHSFCGFSSVKESEQNLLDIAGVKLAVFHILLSLLPSVNKKCTLGKENMLLLLLMKCKLGISFAALGVIVNCHRTTASATFKFTLHHIFEKTKEWIFWPQRSTIINTMPNAFKRNFENCTCILDCSEVSCERPQTVRQRILMFSHYKNTFTLKFLVAITPSGYICFLSKCYGGRATDSYITVHSGILNYIQPGDLVMCDKGFPQIKTCIQNKKAIMVMPPFAFNPQFSAEEVDTTYDIASVRIHVERAIHRMKVFKLLSNKVSMDLLPHIDKILHVIGVLVNFSPPIIKSQD